MNSRTIPVVILAACSNANTFDDVRELLDQPTGEVDADAMASVADDYFQTQQVFAAEQTSGVLQADAGTVSTSGAVTNVQSGLLGAIFCAVDTAASVKTFNDCNVGDTCTVRFDLNSCILRLGGDEQAKGKIRFTLSSQEATEFDRASLDVDFRRWRHTDADNLFLGEGHIGLETTEYKLESKSELLFTSDFDLEFQDFDENTVYRQQLGAGARVTFEELSDGAEVGVELVGWTDPAGARRGAHVVVAYTLTKTWLSDTSVALDFTMQVRGTNGNFNCVWSGTATDIGNAVSYQSGGTCTNEDGESFTWDDTIVVDA